MKVIDAGGHLQVGKRSGQSLPSMHCVGGLASWEKQGFKCWQVCGGALMLRPRLRGEARAAVWGCILACFFETLIFALAGFSYLTGAIQQTFNQMEAWLGVLLATWQVVYSIFGSTSTEQGQEVDSELHSELRKRKALLFVFLHASFLRQPRVHCTNLIFNGGTCRRDQPGHKQIKHLFSAAFFFEARLRAKCHNVHEHIGLLFSLQFRRSKGYLTFMYSEDGLNIDRPQQGGEIKEGDSDALDRKEGEAVKKLKGLYKRYLKSYVEWRLGESEEEADTDSDDEDSDRVMDRGGSKDGKGPTEGGVDSEEGSDYTSQSDGVARTHPQERSETSLSDGVDSEELDFLERDKEEDLAEWQEDYWRWAQGGAMPECDTPLHEGAALQQGENGSQQAAFGSTQSEWASQPSPLPRDGETLSPKTSPVATASAAEQAGQSAQHPLEQELPSQQIPVTRTAPGTQPAQSSSKHAEAAEQQEARPALESERTVTSDSGDPPEAAKLSSWTVLVAVEMDAIPCSDCSD